MKVVLVDDELSALTYLESVVKEIDYISNISTYTNPVSLIKNVEKEQPDILFLDIEMPEVNGIQLAERILAKIPHANIIFTTAYEDYAIEAFELYAVDYVLKPVRLERIKNTINRIKFTSNNENDINQQFPISQIGMFRQLTFQQLGSPSKDLEINWKTSKVRGTFIYLLLHQGEQIRKDTLLELFWPHLEMKNGYTQLYSAIYQIRKILSEQHIHITIRNYEDGYKLLINDTRIDVYEWERKIADNQPVSSDTIHTHLELIRIYKADFLEDEDYVWLENERERIRMLWVHHVLNVADYLVTTDNKKEAISLYLILQDKQPFIEDSYMKLLNIYAQLGNLYEFKTQYIAFEKMLKEQYNTEPPKSLHKLYKQMFRSVRN